MARKAAVARPPEDAQFERGLPLAAILDEYLTAGRWNVSAWVGSRAIKDMDEETPVDGWHPFHMSGGTCRRSELLKWANVAGIPMPGIAFRRFAIGNLAEALLEEACRWKGVLVDAQVRVWRDWAFRAGRGHKQVEVPIMGKPLALNHDAFGRPLDYEVGEAEQVGTKLRLDLSDCLVVGTLDAVLVWSPEWATLRGPIPQERWSDESAKRFLVDWKSVNSKKFDYVDREIDTGYGVQVAGYAETYCDQFAATIDGVRLAYLDKDALRLKQVGIDMETWRPKARARWQEMRAGAEALMGATKAGDTLGRIVKGAPFPPELPAEGNKLHWMCDPRWCGFAVARDASGEYVCPCIGKAWEDALPHLCGEASETLRAEIERGAALHDDALMAEAPDVPEPADNSTETTATTEGAEGAKI
jgi:hypothetical protein